MGQDKNCYMAFKNGSKILFSGEIIGCEPAASMDES